MKNFVHWLVEEKTELPVVAPQDNRELIFGAFGAIKQFIPQIGEFGQSDIHKGMSIPGVQQKYDIGIETNPYLLIVWDNKRKIFARGSNNCAVCQNYDVKRGTCSRYGQTHPVTQDTMQKHDVGGCVALDFLPFFGGGSEQSKKYQGIQFALAKGYIFRYANGQVQPKPLAGPFEIEPKEEEMTPWERMEKEKGY
jgi:hypothetical protein